MSILKIAIGSIKYDLDCQENEQEIITEITKKINRKINLLSLEIGRINEKILLLILLILNTKKIEKIKSGNFEENIINILKIISPLLSAKNDKELEDNLIIANIMKESELIGISKEELNDSAKNFSEDYDRETHYKEMIELVDSLDLIINNFKK